MIRTTLIDVWQIYNLQEMEEVDKLLAPDGAMKAFLHAKAEGHTRFNGVTTQCEPNVPREVIKRAELDTTLMAVNAADRHCLSFSDRLLALALEEQMGIIGMKLGAQDRTRAVTLANERGMRRLLLRFHESFQSISSSPWFHLSAQPHPVRGIPLMADAFVLDR